MKRTLILAAALALAVPFSAAAHKAWLRPSQTVLAGADPWITVDAAVSNDLFYFNHAPIRLDNLVITAPDGSSVQPQNPATGKYRSVFDVQLKQQGTYRIAVVSEGLFASWEEDGKPKRYFIYNICDHAETYKEVRAQAISYTTGVPAVTGVVMMVTKKWKGAGVFNMEQLDPDPFLEDVAKRGLPWHVEER